MKKFTSIIIAATVIYFTTRSNIAPPQPTSTIESTRILAEPFHLTGFQVSLSGKGRVSTWSIEDETGIDHYELQRSGNAREEFKTIAVVNPNKSGSYTYRDDAAFGGKVVYYRLAVVGKDGFARFGNTVILNIDRVPQMTMYPNPALDNVSIAFGDLVERATIKFVNQQGKTVLTVANFSGNNLSQDITKLSAGMYFVQVINGTGASGSMSFIKRGM